MKLYVFRHNDFYGPDEEGIGSTIIIFCHKMNVVLLKKKRYTHCGHCKEEFRGGECLEEHVVLFMKRDLLKCDVCGKHFRRREYLGEHVALFMKGVWSSVMIVGSTSEGGITWESIWCCS